MKTQTLTVSKERQIRIALIVIKVFSACFIIGMALASYFL